jgi:2-polyprenyl-6-hydroxyphenyl methylase/3-demethylubiquinone-9 3-methyltransferase
MVQTSILPEEAERFGKLAADWWDPSGASAMLHKLNPVRLKYVRDQIDQHWQCDECSRAPLMGKTSIEKGDAVRSPVVLEVKGGRFSVAQ